MAAILDFKVTVTFYIKYDISIELPIIISAKIDMLIARVAYLYLRLRHV
jgi:hypothetical protein